MIEYASNAQLHGLCVLPPKEDGSKAPCEDWKKYQELPSTDSDLERWYGSMSGIGYVTGAVSGNLEVMDFDRADMFDLFLDAMDGYGAKELIDRIVGGYMESTPKGVHLFYRCSAIAKNSKLARGEDGKVLIETRGEGGYIVAAPSGKTVNHAGVYTLKSGGVESICTITPKERATLHHIASIFDAQAPNVRRSIGEPAPKSDGVRPGDDYNNKTTWDDLLVRHGWELMFHHNGTDFWRKPGSKSATHHATTNYNGSDLFYVFSSAAAPFEPESSYTKFAVYALLEHGGDFSTAASSLSGDGFGDKTAQVREAIPPWKMPKHVDVPKTSFSAAELEESHFEPPKLLCDIIPEGLIVLGGNPKIGKSWLCLEMLIAADTGRSLFGHYKMKRTPCIYLALEDNPRRMKERLQKLTKPALQFGRHVSVSHDSRIELSWPSLTNGGMQDLADIIETTGSKFIIIDTFACIKPQAGNTGTAYDSDYKAIQPLRALAHAKGVTIMLITHLNKAKLGTDPFEHLQGSMGISGAADCIYVLKKTESGAELYVRGRDIEEQTIHLQFESGMWSYNKALNDDIKVSGYQDVILDCLKDLGKPVKPAEIKKWLQQNDDIHIPGIRGVMLALWHNGIVAKDSYGRYYI